MKRYIAVLLFLLLTAPVSAQQLPPYLGIDDSCRAGASWGIAEPYTVGEITKVAGRYRARPVLFGYWRYRRQWRLDVTSKANHSGQIAVLLEKTSDNAWAIVVLVDPRTLKVKFAPTITNAPTGSASHWWRCKDLVWRGDTLYLTWRMGVEDEWDREQTQALPLKSFSLSLPSGIRRPFGQVAVSINRVHRTLCEALRLYPLHRDEQVIAVEEVTDTMRDYYGGLAIKVGNGENHYLRTFYYDPASKRNALRPRP